MLIQFTMSMSLCWQELEDPLILIHEKKISSLNAVIKVLELALKVSQPFVNQFYLDTPFTVASFHTCFFFFRDKGPYWLFQKMWKVRLWQLLFSISFVLESRLIDFLFILVGSITCFLLRLTLSTVVSLFANLKWLHCYRFVPSKPLVLVKTGKPICRILPHLQEVK